VSIVESKQRVADHGEVFTPAWMVDAMLDLVKAGGRTSTQTLGVPVRHAGLRNPPTAGEIR
jgi:hypothetical protein